MVCSYNGNDCIHGKIIAEFNSFGKGNWGNLGDSASVVRAETELLSQLEADDFLMDSDGELVRHAGDEFNDALAESRRAGKVEHWLDGVKFQPGAHFRVVVGVLYQPVLEGGAQQGVLLEAEAYLARKVR